MADIDRDRRVTTVERGSSAVWIVIVLIVVVLLVALFLWPGWIATPVANDSDSDTINVEQEQEQPDQDINVVVPEESDDTT